MDDIDIAQKRQQGYIDAALKEHNNKQNRDKAMREKMESAGIVLHCKYCDSPLDGYDSSYCDIECKQEHEMLKAVERRNGKV